MEKEKIKQEFDEYVRWCREAVSSLLTLNNAGDQKIPGATSIKKELIDKKKISEQANDIEAIVAKRQELIDVKVNHTARVVADISKVSEKIGITINLQKIVEIVGLLHDIGRFEYATWNNAYGDDYRHQEGRDIYKNSKFYSLATPLDVNNHSEAGFCLLTKKGKIKSLSADPKILKIVSQAVLHHQDRTLTAEFDPKVNKADDKFFALDINKVLTDKETFNEAEIQIYAVLTQLIKDVDCIDILYQHLTGEFPVLRPVTKFNKALMSKDGKEMLEMLSLEEFAKMWGFSVKEVLDFNGMTLEEATSARKLDLPTSKIDPALLVMPSDLKERFFALEPLDLQEINKRYDWNPITGMWWRLLQFLGQLNFTSNLEVIKENELLEKIYECYPPQYRQNVKEAFEFAKRHLLEGRGNDIYATSPLKKK